MQLFWTFNHSGNLLTIAGFLAPLAQYFSATSTGRIWQALILLHLSSSCFFVKHTYLSTCFARNTTFYLIFTFTYLFEETINITLLFTRRIFLLQLLFPSTCSPWYPISLRIQSECAKIRTRKNSVFGHFSYSKMSLISSGDFFSSPCVWTINLLWTSLKLTLIW